MAQLQKSDRNLHEEWLNDSPAEEARYWAGLREALSRGHVVRYSEAQERDEDGRFGSGSSPLTAEEFGKKLVELHLKGDKLGLKALILANPHLQIGTPNDHSQMRGLTAQGSVVRDPEGEELRRFRAWGRKPRSRPFEFTSPLARQIMDEGVLRYSEDQPRDDHGRFGSGSEGSSNPSFITRELTPNEKYAVSEYATSGGSQIQAALRPGSQPRDRAYAAPLLSHLDSAIASSVADKDTQVFRAVDKQFEERVGNREHFNETAYTSTTLDRVKAEEYASRRDATVIQITIPKGSNALHIESVFPNAVKGEHEVLLPRSSSFTLDRASGTWVVDSASSLRRADGDGEAVVESTVREHRDSHTNGYATALALLAISLRNKELSNHDYHQQAQALYRERLRTVSGAIGSHYGVNLHDHAVAERSTAVRALATRAELAQSALGQRATTPYATGKLPSNAQLQAGATSASGPFWAATHVLEGAAVGLSEGGGARIPAHDSGEGGERDIVGHWNCVNDSESCEDCIDLDGQEWPIDEIPTWPGACDGTVRCFGNCRCTIEFDASGNATRSLGSGDLIRYSEDQPRDEDGRFGSGGGGQEGGPKYSPKVGDNVLIGRTGLSGNVLKIGSGKDPVVTIDMGAGHKMKEPMSEVTDGYTQEGVRLEPNGGGTKLGDTREPAAHELVDWDESPAAKWLLAEAKGNTAELANAEKNLESLRSTLEKMQDFSPELKETMGRAVKDAEEELKLLGAPMRFVSNEDAEAYKDKVAGELGKALTEAGVLTRGQNPEFEASDFIHSWAQSSGDHDTVALAIQEEAGKMFGIPMADHLKVALGDSYVRENVNRELENNGDTIRVLLQAQYDHTQAELKAAGIHEVTLYRGADLARPNSNPNEAPTTHSMNLQPLSSFSLQYRTAMQFGREDGQNSAVTAVRVPASRIFSTPKTGFGCLREAEFTVLGGHDLPGTTKWSFREEDSRGFSHKSPRTPEAWGRSK